MLERFLDFFHDRASIDAISADYPTRFVVTLKRDHGLGSNTILHNAVIVAQFLKRHGIAPRIRSIPPGVLRPDVDAEYCVSASGGSLGAALAGVGVRPVGTTSLRSQSWWKWQTRMLEVQYPWGGGCEWAGPHDSNVGPF